MLNNPLKYTDPTGWYIVNNIDDPNFGQLTGHLDAKFSNWNDYTSYVKQGLQIADMKLLQLDRVTVTRDAYVSGGGGPERLDSKGGISYHFKTIYGRHYVRTVANNLSREQSNGQSGGSNLGGAMLGAGLTLGSDALDGSTYRMFNQKGTNFSPRLYPSGWNGGSAGQIKTFGTGTVTKTLTGAGYGLGLYNAYSIEQQYSNGQINQAQRGLEQGSNVISTFGGLPGAAWGIGWELGRAITTIPAYQDFKQNTWLPFRQEYFGY